MTKQTIHVLNSNIDFIQLKLYDFSDEKIDHEKIISERLNKNSKIENTNQTQKNINTTNTNPKIKYKHKP